MVEYVLLIALGFLSAALVALFMAPAIYGRIVALTERRLRATLPMTRQEMRAASDMERAAHAAENARIAVELRKEREKRVSADKRADRLEADVADMRGDLAELVRHIDEMGATTGQMRSEARKMERSGDTLKLALADSERTAAKRDAQLRALKDDMRRRSIEMEDMRIDLATRETEVESLQSTIRSLTEDRKLLREEVKTTSNALKDAEFRLEREETRGRTLEEKVGDTLAKLTDQESLLERRDAEIERLKAKLQAAETELRAAESKLGAMKTDAARSPANDASAPGNGSARIVEFAPAKHEDKAVPADNSTADSKTAISQRVEKLRARHSALIDRLVTVDGGSEDEALRQEIKEIAADMVSLTAMREGDGSPIRKILANARESGSGRQSLAAQASQRIREN